MTEHLFLSRLLPNLRSREARRDLADCVAMHRTLMRAFPGGLSSENAARAEAGVLYRIESVKFDLNQETIGVLVQSTIAPDWSRLPASWHLPDPQPESRAITDIVGNLAPGRNLRFKLVANPTRKIETKTSPDRRKNNGKRVELRGEQEWLDLLQRKAAQSGFRLKSVQASTHVPDVNSSRDLRSTGAKKQPDGGSFRLTFAGVAFEGHLQILDASLFQTAVRAGIGPGKAYGFGLLSLARGD